MASKVRFFVFCVLSKRVSTAEDYWQKIITIKHPSMAGRDAEVQQTLTDADEVRESRSAPQVKLYYRQYDNLYLYVVVKHLNGSGFIVTTYFTDRIKEGITLWTR